VPAGFNHWPDKAIEFLPRYDIKMSYETIRNSTYQQ
jgi:hypothetical protein